LRDLRAELRQNDECIPVEWKPVNGDILVGFVRETTTDAADARQDAVVVEEERTGLPVLVSVDSPYLAALFELHKPRSSDKIGIKYSGVGSTGVDRFIMVIDRQDQAPKRSGKQRAATHALSAETDDCSTATPEERDYISRMLADSSSTPSERNDQSPEDPIKGLLHWQEEEIGRQAKALERLEALVGQSPLQDTSKPDSEADTSQPPPQPAKRARRGFNWLRALALWMALFIASALGALTAVLVKPSLHVWFR